MLVTGLLQRIAVLERKITQTEILYEYNYYEIRGSYNSVNED